MSDPSRTEAEGSTAAPYQEGQTLDPERLTVADEPWTEVDLMKYGAKIDGYYITAEVSEIEVADVTPVDEVAENV